MKKCDKSVTATCDFGMKNEILRYAQNDKESRIRQWFRDRRRPPVKVTFPGLKVR